jgi:KaiC/GvpD/RAD55 family RecA-like ATPase
MVVLSMNSTGSVHQPATSSQPLCAFCGYQIPVDPIWITDAGLAFCSDRCADAYRAGDQPFAGGDSFRLVTTGVSVLDTLLPWGMPANSIVLLAGEEGMRHRGLQTEFIWRTLQRGEHAVIVSFVDAAISIVEEFLAFGWNVLPYLETGRLHVIDCMTNRLREEHQTPEIQTDWNAYLEGFLDDAVTLVRDPTNLREVETKLHDAIETLDIVGSGAIVIDSINEASVQGREVRLEQFIKEVRTDVCKRLFVPILTSTTITEDEDFAENNAYVFDGIVDMRHNEELIPNLRLTQISIRKMDGIQYRPDWLTYQSRGTQGFVAIDLGALIEQATTMSTPDNYGDGNRLPRPDTPHTIT